MNSICGRSLLTLIMCALPFFAAAQPINLQTAIDEFGDEDYKKALKFIEKAKNHDKTKNNPKTWFYTGEIYKEIASSQDSSVRNLAEEPIQKAMKAYGKCMELGGEDTYKQKVSMAQVKLSGPAYVRATEAFNSQNFEKSFELFSLAAQGRGVLAKLKKAKKKGKDKDEMETDTVAFNSIFYAAQSAEQIEKDSIALRMYGQLTRSGFFKGDAFLRMAEIYRQKEQYDKMLETIDKGLEQFPEHSDMINLRAQHYIDNGEFEKAEKSLEKAAERQPDNQNIQLILGGVYETLHNNLLEDSAEAAQAYFDKAVEKYNGIIGKDSSNHNALSQLGLLYYNKGVELNERAGRTEDAEKREEKKKGSEDLMKRSIPILEKAFELQNADNEVPTNETVTRALMKSYAKFSMVEEYKELKKKAGYTSQSGEGGEGQ